MSDIYKNPSFCASTQIFSPLFINFYLHWRDDFCFRVLGNSILVCKLESRVEFSRIRRHFRKSLKATAHLRLRFSGHKQISSCKLYIMPKYEHILNNPAQSVAESTITRLRGPPFWSQAHVSQADDFGTKSCLRVFTSIIDPNSFI